MSNIALDLKSELISKLNDLFNLFYIDDHYWGKDQIIPMPQGIAYKNEIVKVIFKDNIIVGAKSIPFEDLEVEFLSEIFQHAVHSISILNKPGYFITCAWKHPFDELNLSGDLFEFVGNSIEGNPKLIKLQGLLGNQLKLLEEDCRVHINPFRIKTAFEYEGNKYEFTTGVVDSDDFWWGYVAKDKNIFDVNVHFNLEAMSVEVYPVINNEIQTSNPLKNLSESIKP